MVQTVIDGTTVRKAGPSGYNKNTQCVPVPAQEYTRDEHVHHSEETPPSPPSNPSPALTHPERRRRIPVLCHATGSGYHYQTQFCHRLPGADTHGRDSADRAIEPVARK